MKYTINVTALVPSIPDEVMIKGGVDGLGVFFASPWEEFYTIVSTTIGRHKS